MCVCTHRATYFTAKVRTFLEVRTFLALKVCLRVKLGFKAEVRDEVRIGSDLVRVVS